MTSHTFITILSFVCVLASYFKSVSSSISSCSKDFSSVGTSFDLSRLHLDGSQGRNYYKVQDIRIKTPATKAENYTYYFNICDQILDYPGSCSRVMLNDQRYCTNKLDNGTCIDYQPLNVSTSQYAFAYQEKYDTKSDLDCYALSNLNGGPPEWELHHSHNPAEGIMITYKNGAYDDYKCKSNRELRIQFLCENNIPNIPDTEMVTEIESCVYKLSVNSIYGCPIECGIYSNSLCAGHGLCSYDVTNYKSKCFCYFGYDGSACSQSVETSVKPEESVKTAPTGDYVTSFNVSNVTVIYDVGDFHLNNVHFIANDSLNDYTYVFNIMGVLPIDSISSACMNASLACHESDCSTVEIDSHGNNDIGYGFQIRNSDGVCFLLGTNASYELYDTIDYDPARGVSVRYIDGGYCGMVDDEPLNRQFLINLICPTNPDSATAYSSATTNVQLSNISVIETSACEYEISIESVLACPYQCITDEGGVESVCSGQGICAVDPELGFVRCLCDDGMDGIECTEVENTPNYGSVDDHSGFHIAIAIITVFLVLCLLVIVYLGMRHKRMKHELLIALMGGLGEDEDDFNDVTKPDLNFEEPDVHYNDESESDDDDNVGDITPPVQEMITIGNSMQNNDDVFIDVNAEVRRNEEDGDTDEDELSPNVLVKKTKRMTISKFMAKKAGYVNANDEDESDD